MISPGEAEVVRDRSFDLGVRPYTASEWAGSGVTPFGSDVLHTATSPLEVIDERVRQVADYMVQVMHARRGIGLSANQVGLPWRMFVHKLPRVAPQVVINPVIEDVDDSWVYSESCLSMTVAGTRSELRRPGRIVLRALDLSGTEMRIAADELLARVFQHEIDHLDGIVYVQRLNGPARAAVDALMSACGFDVGLLPPRLYRWEPSG